MRLKAFPTAALTLLACGLALPAYPTGGSHGKGQVYRGGDVIGFTSTSDISIGLQAGGQAYSQIIFFENADAMKRFTGGNFEFDASAEAIAVQAKAEASAGTEGAGLALRGGHRVF